MYVHFSTLTNKGVTQFKTEVWDPPRVCHNPEPLNITVQVKTGQDVYLAMMQMAQRCGHTKYGHSLQQLVTHVIISILSACVPVEAARSTWCCQAFGEEAHSTQVLVYHGKQVSWSLWTKEYVCDRMCDGHVTVMWHQIAPSLYIPLCTVPSPPLHTSAVAKEESNGTSQVTVTWQTPSQEFTPVISYFLELVYRDETRVWHPITVISLTVPRVSLNNIHIICLNCTLITFK